MGLDYRIINFLFIKFWRLLTSWLRLIKEKYTLLIYIFLFDWMQTYMSFSSGCSTRLIDLTIWQKINGHLENLSNHALPLHWTPTSESMFDCETTLFNVKQRQYVVGMRLNMIITHKLGYIYTNYSNKGWKARVIVH